MEVIKHEGVFRLFDKHGSVILTDEKQLDRIIQGPDTPLFDNEDMGFSFERQNLNGNNAETLRSKCVELKNKGCTRMDVSYDFFFGGSARHNYPSDEKTIKAFKVIHDTAKEYGMSFGASILSPLDVGGGWIKVSNETGFTCQFCETEIRPDGSYRVDMRCQQQWYNNKGPIHLIPHKALAYAFNEERVGNTNYYAVDENAILDISDTVRYTIDEEQGTVSSFGYGSCPMQMFGQWDAPTANRVLCVMVYRTPELDYFAPSARKFMKEVLDQHNEAGIDYAGFYSDEMHIQFDWDLETHFGEKEVQTRYITSHLADTYADLYGDKFRDFTKYLVYMSYQKCDFLPDGQAEQNIQHVFGPTPKDIYDTWLFRNRYFELLQRTVVNLANDGKSYAESLWGAPIMTRAHATWQESPTCDHYYKVANAIGGFNLQGELGEEFADVDVHSPIERRAALEKAKTAKERELGVSRYDYTPYYDWSSSIRENIAACYDYFKWNEFLCGGGTDHAEGGNLDRNYYSHALATSFGDLNKYGMAYCACWGMPKPVHALFDGVGQAYGSPNFSRGMGFVNDLQHRCSDVLAMYPIKLNNVEERFGSWMVQYGYCSYITEEKLLENAQVTDHGTVRVKDKEYRCLLVMFEPFLNKKTFELIETLLARGGKVLWMSVPALTDADGGDEAERFKKIFGLQTICDGCFSERHKGESVQFGGRLAGMEEMPILTDFLVDAVYPCAPAAEAEAVACIAGKPVAVCKSYPNGGAALYAGFRVRDDQSCSLGRDVDTLFRMLCAIDAYRPGSLEVRSRRSDSAYVMNTFANGSVNCAPHYRGVYEAWEGTFFRDEDYDKAIMEGRTIPDGRIELDEDIQGHHICFAGRESLSYRLDEAGVPVAFGSKDTDGITVDGVKYTYADRKADFEFAPVDAKFLADGVQNAVAVYCGTEGAVLTIPTAAKTAPQALGCKDYVFGAEIPVASSFADGKVTFTVTPELAGHFVMITY